MTTAPEYGVAVTNAEHKYRAEAIAGLVLGIVSVVLAPSPMLGLACGIVGIILSAKSREMVASRTHSGMASAGIVLSIVGIVLGGLATLFWIATFFGASFGGWADELQEWMRGGTKS